MELWEQAIEYQLRALETKNGDKQIELFDKAISLYMQLAEQEETEKSRLIGIAHARMSEASKHSTIAVKLDEKAKSSSGIERARYSRESASYMLSAYSSSKEAAEINKKIGNIADYHACSGFAYLDQAFHRQRLAFASAAVDNWDEALSDYKESLSLLEDALESFNKSLQIKFNQHIEHMRKDCFSRIRNAELEITTLKTARLTEPPATQQVFHIANFTGEIGRDKQVAGGDIVGGSKTGDVGVLRGGVGSDEKAFSNCPYCGEALNLPKTPRYCPFCGGELR